MVDLVCVPWGSSPAGTGVGGASPRLRMHYTPAWQYREPGQHASRALLQVTKHQSDRKRVG